MTTPVNVDVKLGVNKFHVDEGTRTLLWRQIPISIGPELNESVPRRTLQEQDDGRNIHFDYAGCLECGTCRMLGRRRTRTVAIPAGTFGVEFRYG